MSLLPLILLVSGVLLATLGNATAASSAASTTGATIDIRAADVVCPQKCSCLRVPTDQGRHYTFAHCTSIAGLTQHPKTGDIQAVGLANIGLQSLGGAVNKLTNLTIADLSHNRLAAAPAMPRAHRLRALYLDFNQITSGKLLHIPASVEHLNLSHNHLTNVPVAAVQRLHRLHTIALAGNSINCSCETLQSRSWLAARHVTVDDVRCATPAAAAGRSWHTLSEHDVCAAERGSNIWSDGDNEMMLGDQAIVEDAAEDVRGLAEQEFERDFIPIDRQRLKRQSLDALENELDDFDGSGDDGSGDVGNGTFGAFSVDSGNDTTSNETSVSEATSTEPDAVADEDEDDDGSGSTPLVLFKLHDEPSSTTEAPTTETETAAEISTTTTEDEPELDVTPPPIAPLNIFTFSPDTDDTADSTESDTIAPVHVDEKPSSRVADSTAPHRVTAAEKETAESTYIVLVMLAILLLGLIVFVIIRRKNAARRRRNFAANGDPENGNAKELVDMNRTHPGKPVQPKNGAEVLPLIGARDKWDSRIQPANGLSKPDQEELARAQEPLLRKLDGDSPVVHDSDLVSGGERSPQAAPRTLAPRPSSAASVGSVASAGTGDKPETNNNDQLPAVGADQNDLAAGNETDQPQVFQPISPKPARYSPVYSPETGRVKIKLTETPRPRTPMLVSRTRSNAGDIVLRPAK